MKFKIICRAAGIFLALTVALAPCWSAQAADGRSLSGDPTFTLKPSGETVEHTPIQDTYPIMRPDRETLWEWVRAYEEAPRAPVDEELMMRMPLQGSKSLLSHLNYVPSERNQGSCGNCWAWAGTGVMGIDLDVNKSVFDRLSVQYINSCKSGTYACCGGSLSYVSDFYTSHPQAIPWSNANASYADGSRTCSSGSSSVSCGSISTSPNYAINSITAQTITTQGVSNATAIANIKNVLDQNKAVWFGFYLPDNASWGDFYAFWNNQSESALWDPDPYCGQTYVTNEGGGHAVLCVGYNDDDANPDNHYWIMVNSWGTAGGGRPNGIYRVKMNINYSCQQLYEDDWFYALTWQTLDMDWAVSDDGCSLINDGSFENGPPPGSAWTEWSNHACGSLIVDVSSAWGIPANHGTYAYWAGGYCNGVPMSGYVEQSISIPSSATELKFMANYYRPDADDPEYPDYLYVKINGVTVFTKGLTQANDTYPNWTEDIVNISAYAGQTVTLQFEGSSAGDSTGNVLIDYIRMCGAGGCCSFYEDFNDGVADNWVNDGSGKWAPISGVYRATGTAGGTARLYSYYDCNGSDFIYEARVRKTSGSTSGAIGLLFRFDGTAYGQNHYGFNIIPDGQYCVYKYAEGSMSFLQSWTSSTAIHAGLNSWNTLKVEAMGNSIKVYCNGTLLGSFTDSSHSTGHVGLAFYESTDTQVGEFDDARLTDLTCGSAFCDFDGDGATDVAAFHLPTDQFFTDYAGNMGQYGWGGSDAMPLVWDYDGDGATDVSIYHIPTNQWFVRGYSGDNLGQFGWGGDESIPVPGDYNGDGIMERAFYHWPTNRWFVEGQDAVDFGWGGAAFIPLPGDYDGDGTTDRVAYHIPSNQWFQYGIGNLGQYGWGGSDCVPVPADYDGDGITDIAVYHVPTNQWFVRGYPGDNLGQYGWGGMESFPIPGDYNGDGTVERGFYRYSQNWWFIEGEADFVWGWGGAQFMPITSQIAVYNWFRFVLGMFQ